jgi:hypothetical protein
VKEFLRTTTRERGQNKEVTQLLRPGTEGPPETADERQNPSVEQNVQLEKEGKGFAAR